MSTHKYTQTHLGAGPLGLFIIYRLAGSLNALLTAVIYSHVGTGGERPRDQSTAAAKVLRQIEQIFSFRCRGAQRTTYEPLSAAEFSEHKISMEETVKFYLLFTQQHVKIILKYICIIF